MRPGLAAVNDGEHAVAGVLYLAAGVGAVTMQSNRLLYITLAQISLKFMR
jgi:hypothetical protein